MSNPQPSPTVQPPPPPQQPSLPRVLLLSPPFLYTAFSSSFSLNFNFIKSFESPLPLPDFLASSHSSSSPPPITALLVTAGGPPITSSILRLIPDLRCIVTCSSGVSHIDMDVCRERGIGVANAGDVFGDDVADFAVGMVVDVMRRVTAGERAVRGREEHRPRPGKKLSGRKVGIVGLGNIGAKVAKRLEAFCCEISYNSRRLKPSVPYQYYSDVNDLASNVDILILCCALTDQTRHLINKEVLSKLGKDGIIINVARGAIIDEEELVRCLVEKRIAGAGLDVFENEPVVPKELFQLDNVVFSPHRAAFTLESFHDLYELVTGNLKAFFAGKPLLSPVLDY